MKDEKYIIRIGRYLWLIIHELFPSKHDDRELKTLTQWKTHFTCQFKIAHNNNQGSAVELNVLNLHVNLIHCICICF